MNVRVHFERLPPLWAQQTHTRLFQLSAFLVCSPDVCVHKNPPSGPRCSPPLEMEPPPPAGGSWYREDESQGEDCYCISLKEGGELGWSDEDAHTQEQRCVSVDIRCLRCLLTAETTWSSHRSLLCTRGGTPLFAVNSWTRRRKFAPEPTFHCIEAL